MMEAVANTGATDSEAVAGDATYETGVDEVELQQSLDAEYKRKRERLDQLEGEAREMRIVLAEKDKEIDMLREELCLTPVAQLKRTVENSVIFQKTRELGDRVKSSETFTKTSSTLSAAGQATSEAIGSAATKTGTAFSNAATSVKESQTWQGLGSRWRSASQSMKEKFSQEPAYSESSQNHEAEESQSYANTST